MIIDLNLKGRQVVIAGGGREATRKVEALIPQDCEIIVFAERFSEEIGNWEKEGKVLLKQGKVSGGEFLKDYDRLILVKRVSLSIAELTPAWIVGASPVPSGLMIHVSPWLDAA